MWFPETSIVHTFFMRFALDIVFLDRDEVVLKVCAHVPPWRIAIGPPGTRSVLETISCVPSVLGSVEPGHRLRLSCDDAGGDGTIEAS
jgi:hypothetical protein